MLEILATGLMRAHLEPRLPGHGRTRTPPHQSLRRRAGAPGRGPMTGAPALGVVFVVAEVVGHLGLQGPLHQARRQLVEIVVPEAASIAEVPVKRPESALVLAEPVLQVPVRRPRHGVGVEEADRDADISIAQISSRSSVPLTTPGDTSRTLNCLKGHQLRARAARRLASLRHFKEHRRRPTVTRTASRRTRLRPGGPR
jgi:hypothetical protein